MLFKHVSELGLGRREGGGVTDTGGCKELANTTYICWVLMQRSLSRWYTAKFRSSRTVQPGCTEIFSKVNYLWVSMWEGYLRLTSGSMTLDQYTLKTHILGGRSIWGMGKERKGGLKGQSINFYKN